MIQNHKKLMAVLAAEAVLLAALCLLGGSGEAWAVGSFALPLVLAGDGLRWLSLSGALGNAVAILLYAVLSLLPVAAFLWLRRRGRGKGADALLLLLTLLLFITLYYMVNPDLAPGGAGGLLAFGGAVWAALFSWLVLRALAHFWAADQEGLESCLGWLLRGLAILFVFAVFGEAFTALTGALSQGADRFSLLCFLLRWVAEALPWVLDVVLILAALDLLAARRADPYGATAVTAAHRLADLCVSCLMASVLVTLAADLAQLLFLERLYDVHVVASLPVISVAFAAALLLGARLVGENKALKDDNDLFI